METVSEALSLLNRQLEIEAAMKRPGGIRITEERELLALRRQLSQCPDHIREAVHQAHASRQQMLQAKEPSERWASAG
jgi:hypothetical protein